MEAALLSSPWTPSLGPVAEPSRFFWGPQAKPAPPPGSAQTAGTPRRPAGPQGRLRGGPAPQQTFDLSRGRMNYPSGSRARFCLSLPSCETNRLGSKPRLEPAQTGGVQTSPTRHRSLACAASSESRGLRQQLPLLVLGVRVVRWSAREANGSLNRGVGLFVTHKAWNSYVHPLGVGLKGHQLEKPPIWGEIASPISSLETKFGASGGPCDPGEVLRMASTSS